MGSTFPYIEYLTYLSDKYMVNAIIYSPIFLFCNKDHIKTSLTCAKLTKLLKVQLMGAAILTISCWVMIGGRNVSPNYEKGAKRLSKLWLGGETSFWLGGETSFVNMKRGRNVFPNYKMGAKHLSEIWFGGETSFWNMVKCVWKWW